MSNTAIASIDTWEGMPPRAATESACPWIATHLTDTNA